MSATISKSQITVSIATLAAALSLLALAAPIARATPTWLPPQNVFSTPVTSIQDDQFFNRKALDVVSDGEGDAVAVWIEEHPKNPGPGTECQAMFAFRNPGQSFGAPQPLAPPMAFCTGQIQAAMNSGDTTVVAWSQGDDIDAAIRPPFGPFGAPTTLSASASTDDPWVSINDAGVAAVSWDDENVGSCPGLTANLNWVFHASIRQPGGGFGPFETVCDTSHPSGPTIYTPRVLVDQQGDVVATWVNQFNDGANGHFDVEAAYRPTGGSFTGQAPQVLRDMLNPVALAGSFAADIAVDAQGRATAVWPFFNGTKTVIETATRPPGASSMFSAPGPVSDPLAMGNANSPRVAVDPSTNTAVAVWVQCPSSCQVEGAARPSGGGFQTPQALSAGGATTTFGPLVAFDPSGGALAIWSGPSPDVSGTQVQVARRAPGLNQTFGAVTTISTDTVSQSPALAFDGEGNAIALWEHDTGPVTPATLQYAGFDGAPPEIQKVSTPGGHAGAPVSFSAQVFDRWSSSTVAWNFGDGNTAAGPAVTHTYKNHGTYHVTVTATDAVGNQSSSSTTVAIGCAKPPKGTKFNASCHKIKTPLVSFTVNFRAANKGGGRARFTSIVVTKLSRHAKVQIRCLGKHNGCPFKSKAIKKTGSKANLAKVLKGHILAPGAIIQIRGTRKGSIGAVANLKVHDGTASLAFLCIPKGKSKPQSKCKR
jgi:hypothetical protein